MGEKKDKKKKVKFLVTLSISLTFFLLTVLLVIWSILLSDKTRSTHIRSEATSGEIIKKNYIKGLEKLDSNNEEFTFRLREDEINDLLYDGVKSLDDKYIDNIYYERGGDNSHIFYVDLNKTIIKTRVVISTSLVTPTDTLNPSNIYLHINNVTIGKVPASKYLIKKGYLTSNYLNKYFEATSLPISYDEDNFNFVISPYKYIDYFPKEELSSLLWDNLLSRSEVVTINPTSLGFNVDFSKLRTNESIEVTNSSNELPNFYNDVKSSFEAVDFGSMSIGDKVTAYSLKEDDFNNLVSKSLPTYKEEITSNLLSSKAIIELVGSKTCFNSTDKIDVALIYSINGYFFDVHTYVELIDNSSNYVDFSLEFKYDVTLGSETLSGLNNKYVSYFVSTLREIFKNIQEKQGNFFTFSETQDTLTTSLEDMNNTFSSTLRDAEKEVEINVENKTIDFNVTKSTF